MKQVPIFFGKFSLRFNSSQLMAVVTITVILSILLFTTVSWHIWRMYSGFPSAIAREFQLQDLSGKILWFDEILTMSARMAVITGNTQWEERYYQFEPQLDKSLQQLFEIAPAIYTIYATQTAEANKKLIAMEKQAFQWLHQGKQELAYNLLFSEEYEQQKRIYANGAQFTVTATQHRIETQLYDYEFKLFWSGIFAVMSVLVLTLAWITILRLMINYFRHREQFETELEMRVMKRTAELAQAGAEVLFLSEQLEAENVRLSAELQVTRQLQQMLLPKPHELESIKELEISSFMEPAEEVGGDYYDILQHEGRIKIGIGDVTGHGLESGVLMLMVQTVVRTLLISNVTDTNTFFTILNWTIYDNLQRIGSDKSLTLMLLDYQQGTIRLSGQHEEVLVVRREGIIERIKTIDLGFPIGLQRNISEFIKETEIRLNPGDGIVLYTDGITETQNSAKVPYSTKRLCEIVLECWQQSAVEIQRAVIADVYQHLGNNKILDDITLLVLKQKSL